jgi:hypothetical protein
MLRAYDRATVREDSIGRRFGNSLYDSATKRVSEGGSVPPQNPAGLINAAAAGKGRQAPPVWTVIISSPEMSSKISRKKRICTRRCPQLRFTAHNLVS